MAKNDSNIWIILVIVVIFIVVVTGGLGVFWKIGGDKPVFENAYTDPSYLIPNNNENKEAKIIYEIHNPTLLDFIGKVEFLFDDDCLYMYEKNQQVSAKSKSNQAFNKVIRVADVSRNVDLQVNSLRS